MNENKTEKKIVELNKFGRPKQKSYVEYVRESKLREILKRCNN